MNVTRLNDEVVAIGSTVAVRDLGTNEVDVYTLVPPKHADISLNRISSLTPVAHALYGRRVGDTVEVLAPGGAIHLVIVSIRDAASEGEYG
jgi:transcription elongation factor GreA